MLFKILRGVLDRTLKKLQGNDYLLLQSSNFISFLAKFVTSDICLIMCGLHGLYKK